MLGDSGEFGADTVTLDDTMYYGPGSAGNWSVDMTSQAPQPTYTPPAAPVYSVQTAAAVPAAPTNWGSILTPIASAVSSIFTQSQITTRQQQMIAAGQNPALLNTQGLLATSPTGQSTILGVPAIYVIGGIAAFLLLK